MNERHFRVTGMKGEGFVARARTAVLKVSGAVDAAFNLRAGTAVVEGPVEPTAVIEALTRSEHAAALEND